MRNRQESDLLPSARSLLSCSTYLYGYKDTFSYREEGLVKNFVFCASGVLGKSFRFLGEAGLLADDDFLTPIDAHLIRAAQYTLNLVEGITNKGDCLDLPIQLLNKHLDDLTFTYEGGIPDVGEPEIRQLLADSISENIIRFSAEELCNDGLNRDLLCVVASELAGIWWRVTKLVVTHGDRELTEQFTDPLKFLSSIASLPEVDEKEIRIFF